jgi:hypothetical protein
MCLRQFEMGLRRNKPLNEFDKMDKNKQKIM